MSRTVVITGASSGLGEALALRYARDRARLGLIGRDRERLESVASRCRAAGATPVEIGIIDIRARDALEAWISEFNNGLSIDLLIANAGITGGTTPEGGLEATDASIRIFEVNVFGVVNAVHAALPGMLRHGAGQIAIVSSLAAYVPLKDSPSYSASKSAIMTYGLALHEALRSKGIGVTVVCPGYIDTPMSRQLNCPKPFMVTPEVAAETIHRGIADKRRLITFPAHLALTTRLSALLPSWLSRLTRPSFQVTPRQNE